MGSWDTPPLCNGNATGSPTAHALPDSREYQFPRMRTDTFWCQVASYCVTTEAPKRRRGFALVRSEQNRNRTGLELRITSLMEGVTWVRSDQDRFRTGLELHDTNIMEYNKT